MHQPAGARLQRRLDRARIGDCLRETLVARAPGLLVPARPGTSGPVLSVRLDALALGAAEGSNLRGSDPLLTLSVTASAMPMAGPGTAAQAQGRSAWRWDGAPRWYFDVAAEDGHTLQQEFELAIGILAQRILADLFPGDVAPPPARNDARAAQLRASCPSLASATGAVHTEPAVSPGAPR